MNRKLSIYACLSAALALLPAADVFAVKGDSFARAASLTMKTWEQSDTVTLVPQYNEAMAAMGSITIGGMSMSFESPFGVYYIAFTAEKGKAYSVWMDSSAEEREQMTVSTTLTVSPNIFDLSGNNNMHTLFTPYMDADGQTYQIVRESDWQANDAARGTYYVQLMGKKGDKVTIHWMEGLPIRKGLYDNPIHIVPANPAVVVDATMTDSNCYYTATLTAGRMYRFKAVGGSAADPVSLELSADPTTGASFRILEQEDSEPGNPSWIAVPGGTGKHWILLTSGAAKPGLSALLFKTRSINEHTATPIANLEDWVSEAFSPGRVNDTPDCYDDIMDSNLFKFRLAAGQRVVFETTGAATNLFLRVFNAAGETVAENTGKENSYDCRIGYEAPSAGDYWVGVAQNLADDRKDPLLGGSVILRTIPCKPVEGQPDEADPADDTYVGASMLNPVVAGPAADPREVDSGLRLQHQLSATDWTDVFAIGARKDITYRIKAKTETKTSQILGAEVYVLSGGKEVAYPKFTGNLSPNANGVLEFTAEVNGMYYIHVYVANGKGLDYVSYTMHASAYSKTGDLRSLTVNLVGPSPADNAYWQFTADGSGSTVPKYASGASVLVTGEQTLRFGSSSKDLKTPANVTVAEDETEKTIYFTDKYDPGDDTPSKAISISSAAKEATASRTLYADDPQDCFVFTAAAGTYYNFELRSVTADAVFAIRSATTGELIDDIEGRTSLLRKTFPAGKYNVIVSHEKPLDRKDGSYLLAYSSAKVGELKLAKSEISVKEDAGYVDVTVNRTASEGLVRLKFGTFSGTAVPGREYVATNGVLTWANGDNKAKTVRVKLIPDVVATWEENKSFRVVFSEFGEDELLDGEYPVKMTLPKAATITLTETAKKAPGTIQVAGGFDAKKPVFTIKAGDFFDFALVRTLGVNGNVGVSVTSVKGTANKNGETDFEPISVPVIWADGEEGLSEPIRIVTKKTFGDFTGTKTFTLKLTALTSKKDDPVQYDKPTIASATITVNIVNDKYEQNVTDYAKTLPKDSAVTVKEAKKDSWFRTADGELYSVVSRKFTGPSRLWWGPSSDPFRTDMFVSAKGETVSMGAGDVYTNDLLTAATAAAPTVDKAVLVPGPLKLAFDRLPDDEARGIAYRVYILENGAKVLRPGARSAVNLKLGDPETEIVQDLDGDYVTNVLWTSTNQGKYTWRVDSYFIGGTVTNTAKSAWSFTVPKLTQLGPAMTVEGAEDVYSTNINLGVTYELKVAGSLVKSITIVSGTKLPDGLKIEQDKTTMNWYVRGYPTKADDFQAVIQSTNVDTPTLKSPTYVLKFHVNGLEKPVALAPTLDKAVVTPGKVQLCFSRQEGAAYAVYFKDPSNKGTLGKDETLVTDPDFKVEVAAGAKCTWKVVATYPGQDAKAKAVESATFNLTGAAKDLKTTVVGQDAYGTTFAEGVTMRLRQRLAAAFEIADPTATKVAAIGTLPAGLKIEQDKGTTKAPGTMKWFLRGAPTKAGTFSFLVQATFGTDVAATTAMSVTVEAVDAPADLSFTLKGPGRFTYTATDARIPVKQPGKTVTLTNFISKSSETLKLSDVERLHAYEYVKLDDIKPAAPTVDKASVRCGAGKLWFNRLPNDTENGIGYAVYLLGKGEKAGTKTLKLGDPETKRDFALSGARGTADVELGFGTNYSWRVDSFFVGGPVTNVIKTAWALNTVAANALETELKGELLGNRDAYGNLFETDGQKLLLLQGVKFDFTVGIAAGSNKVAAVKLVAGKLPDGLKIETVKPNSRDDSTWTFHIRGVPTKAGEFQPVVQTSYGAKSPCTTTAMDFEVRALDYAIGTFNGILFEDGAALTNGLPTVGTVEFTAASSGKLSAKVALAGKTYSFSANGFDYLEDEHPELPGCTRFLSAKLYTPIQKINNVAYSNTLSVLVMDGSTANLGALGENGNTAALEMFVPDANGKGVQETAYEAALYRNNKSLKFPEYFKAQEAFAGYYTVSLPATDAEYGKPQGNGYVTITLDGKGGSKVAGKLADGNSVSCSYFPAVLGDLLDPQSCELVIPVYQCKSPWVFGGEIRIHFAELDGEMVPVADPTCTLRWCNDNAALTRWGDEGWRYRLSPAGGWYDKVVNLQAYYLNDRFQIDAGATDDLPFELLAAGYDFVPSTMPSGEKVDVSGNTLSVAKQVQVKDADRLIDFNATVNPSGVKVSFARATGIVSGSFSVWSETMAGKRAQKAISGFKHEGVLVLARDPLSFLDPSVWTSGYYLAPSATITETGANGRKVTRKYTESRPFNILAIPLGEIDWCADDLNPECELPNE